jgi:hypothetical protein
MGSTARSIRPLTEVMIDSVDLFLFPIFADRAHHFPSVLGILAEWLLDDEPIYAFRGVIVLLDHG